MFDFITIGSATMDVFVETQDARIVSVSSPESKSEFMSFPYGSKLDVDNFAFEIGGGALNTALNFANLGFDTATIVKIGDDPMAKAILQKIDRGNVETKYVIKSPDEKSGFSVILTSFQGDRTVLAHRGTNATLKAEEIDFKAIKHSKWLYLAPLNGNSTKCLDEIAEFAQEHGTKLAINLGTSSIRSCKNNLPAVLSTAEITIMNSEEAQMLTGLSIRPDTSREKFSDSFIHPDMAEILKELKSLVEQEGVVAVTDGKNGVYAFDGSYFYRCNEFPASVVSTLGAGDAFASTFTAVFSTLEGSLTEKMEKALAYASVNAASVVEHFGAQRGFLTFDEIKERLSKFPSFKVQKTPAV